jgi:anti-sigma factor RsiW
VPDRCDAVEPLLSAWVDGELDERHERAVARHVRRCPDCARALEHVGTVRDLVRNLPQRRAAGELVAAVPLRALAGPASLPRSVKAFAVAASLLLGAILGLGAAGEPEVPHEAPPTEAFMAELLFDQLSHTFGPPVTTPVLLEAGP